MKLKEYLEKNNMKIIDLQKKTGLTHYQIYHVLNGRNPSLITALKIEKETNEAVRAKDLITEKVYREIYET